LFSGRKPTTAVHARRSAKVGRGTVSRREASPLEVLKAALVGRGRTGVVDVDDHIEIALIG
jgi:hypothetical protein